MTVARQYQPARHTAHRVRGLAVHIGGSLRRERERLRRSQDATASAIGTWQDTLSRFERGLITGMPLETFLRLVDHLGLSIEFIARDDAVRRYQEERDAAIERGRARQLELMEEARAEMRKPMGNPIQRREAAVRRAREPFLNPELTAKSLAGVDA